MRRAERRIQSRRGGEALTFLCACFGSISIASRFPWIVFTRCWLSVSRPSSNSGSLTLVSCRCSRSALFFLRTSSSRWRRCAGESFEKSLFSAHSLAWWVGK